MSQLSDTLNSNTPDPSAKSEGQSVAAFSGTAFSGTAFSGTAFSTGSFIADSSLRQTTIGHKQPFDQHNPYHVQVPLSLFSTKTPKPFTGSALLDSFESDRTLKPGSEPQYLKLVTIAQPSRLENVTQAPTVEGMPAQEPHFSTTPNASTSDNSGSGVSPSSTSTSSVSPSSTSTASDSSPEAPAPTASGPGVSTASTSPPNASVSISRKSIRDSAAAVGLIDLNDTLLFGGDRHKPGFSSPAAHIGLENIGLENSANLLSYLSQQVSAFTVIELHSKFPINTDLRVINYPDPPRHQTVLDIQSFRLGQLVNLDNKLSKEPTQPSKAIDSRLSSAQETVDIYALRQKVEDLNQKIAALTQKLSKASNSSDQ